MDRATSFANVAGCLPARAGIGLRAPHYRDFLHEAPAVGWVEVHSENFFAPAGDSWTVLRRARRDYPVSLHGVGLSLGSVDALSKSHLTQLKALAQAIEPAAVSEHLSWGAIGTRHLHDLLPLPYTEEALAHFCRRVQQAQEQLGRRLLIENVSSYLKFNHSSMDEWVFLAELASRTGCGILLDINNVLEPDQGQ